jgi:hypothetical protein
VVLAPHDHPAYQADPDDGRCAALKLVMVWGFAGEWYMQGWEGHVLAAARTLACGRLVAGRGGEDQGPVRGMLGKWLNATRIARTEKVVERERSCASGTGAS